MEGGGVAPDSPSVACNRFFQAGELWGDGGRCDSSGVGFARFGVGVVSLQLGLLVYVGGSKKKRKEGRGWAMGWIGKMIFCWKLKLLGGGGYEIKGIKKR